jgi:hypothetical protein
VENLSDPQELLLDNAFKLAARASELLDNPSRLSASDLNHLSSALLNVMELLAALEPQEDMGEMQGDYY